MLIASYFRSLNTFQHHLIVKESLTKTKLWTSKPHTHVHANTKKMMTQAVNILFSTSSGNISQWVLHDLRSVMILNRIKTAISPTSSHA